MIEADGPITLTAVGGTDVRWSPTIDYFKSVFLSALSEFGAQVKVEVPRRGYYPRGGGSVVLSVFPGSMKPAYLKPQTKGVVEGISHCSNLPEHVARRQAESATRALMDAGQLSEVATEVLKETSTGSGITLWRGYKGGSALGERGIKAEDVGKEAASGIIAELLSPAAVDVHLADQLIPYLALAGGGYSVRQISEHATTNIWTARRFSVTEIDVTEEGDALRIEGHPGR
jgi:RNA 3'-terminal phosphate cyclase (ATP)